MSSSWRINLQTFQTLQNLLTSGFEDGLAKLVSAGGPRPSRVWHSEAVRPQSGVVLGAVTSRRHRIRSLDHNSLCLPCQPDPWMPLDARWNIQHWSAEFRGVDQYQAAGCSSQPPSCCESAGNSNHRHPRRSHQPKCSKFGADQSQELSN